MIIKFLRDLANKPYEVRYRIFWFTMGSVAVIAIIGWLFLIKNYKFNKETNGANFKMPSLNEIFPPDLMDKFKNISNDINAINNNIQLNNNIGNSIISNNAIGNAVDVPINNNFKSENSYIN